VAHEARKRAFFEAMDALRGRRERPKPPEVARVALDSGLTLPDASLAVADHEFGRRIDSEAADALNELVARLCRGPRCAKVLEYTATVRLLTGDLADGPQEVKYLCPYEHVAETMRVLLTGKAASLVRGISELPKGYRIRRDRLPAADRVSTAGAR
jgi:hypothetical protein